MARRDRAAARRSAAVRSARRPEERFPLGFEPPERQTEAIRGRLRRSREAETGVLERPVLLPGVAAAARGDDVVPRVRPTARSRDHVIEVLRRRTAVLTTPIVASEDGSPRQRRRGSIRHADEVAQPQDRRSVHLDPLGAEPLTVRDDDLGLLLQHEDDRPPRRDDCERLVRRVEHQSSSHRGPASIRTALTGLGCLNRANHDDVIRAGGGSSYRSDAWSCEQGPRGASGDWHNGPPLLSFLTVTLARPRR